jgi:hypothetical protein
MAPHQQVRRACNPGAWIQDGDYSGPSSEGASGISSFSETDDQETKGETMKKELVTMYVDVSLTQRDEMLPLENSMLGQLHITGHWRLTPETAGLIERLAASLQELGKS